MRASYFELFAKDRANIEAGLYPYDVQGPIAVIEAAGGIVTDWQGNPVHMGGRVLAAANAEIHAEALALLNA